MLKYLLFFLFFTQCLFGQRFETDCPEISEADWALTDTSAVVKGYDAVVLCNYASFDMVRTPGVASEYSWNHLLPFIIANYLYRVKVVGNSNVVKNKVGSYDLYCSKHVG
jgi:hypothetical protein